MSFLDDKKVLLHQPNVLFLDEPTNDLDLATLSVLEQFLDHFSGCLIVVSHDRYFLDRNVDYLATFEKRSISARYPGPYSAYQKRRRDLVRDDSDQNPDSPSSAAVRTDKLSARQKKDRSRTLSWKETRELATLEESINSLEEERARIENAVNQAGGDFQRLRELSDRLLSLEMELHKYEARWLELSNREI